LKNTVTVNLNQQGKTFIFPIAIDIYEETGKTRTEVWVDKAQTSFTFPYKSFPKLINVDAKHVLLAQIEDKKSLENYIYQFNNAPRFLDRKLSLDEIVKHQQTTKEAYNTVVKAFNDPYYKIRIQALENIDLFQKQTKRDAIAKIEFMAQNDPSTLVRAAAISVLGKLIDPIYKPIFVKGLKSESFAVIGNSLVALYQIDKPAALADIDLINEAIQEQLADAITNIYINEKDKTKLPFIAKHVLKGMFLSQNPKTQKLYGEAFQWIAESDNMEAITNLTNDFVALGMQFKKYNFDKMAINMLNQLVLVQEQSDNSNKNELIIILKTGIAELIQ
jgi:aminopeptidase N